MIAETQKHSHTSVEVLGFNSPEDAAKALLMRMAQMRDENKSGFPDCGVCGKPLGPGGGFPVAEIILEFLDGPKLVRGKQSGGVCTLVGDCCTSVETLDGETVALANTFMEYLYGEGVAKHVQFVCEPAGGVQ
jgi:hypothetical protein